MMYSDQIKVVKPVNHQHTIFTFAGRITEGPWAGGFWIDTAERDPGNYVGTHRLSRNWQLHVITTNGRARPATFRTNLRGGAFG